MNQQHTFAATLVIAFCAAALLTVTGCSAPPTDTRPGVNAHVDDATLNSQIQAKIAAVPGLNDLGITVSTFKGVVHLSGYTHSDAQKAMALRLASETDGVLRIDNDILVKG